MSGLTVFPGFINKSLAGQLCTFLSSRLLKRKIFIDVIKPEITMPSSLVKAFTEKQTFY